MARSHSSLLIAIAGALALVVGVAAWLLGRADQGPSHEVAAAVPGASAPVVEAPLDGPGERADEGPSGVASYAGTETSVAWPVKVELELVRGAHVPRAKGLPPMGSGATARFSGRIQRGERGIVAKLSFTSGPNAGRALECNEKGEFGAIDLYPGIAEVRVDGEGLEAVREVRLRQNQRCELNVSFDLPGAVSGTVFDREGNPLEGVDVELDGVHAQTDAQGVFTYNASTGGDAVRLILRKEGFAAQSTQIAVAAGRRIDHDSAGLYKYTLQPAAVLEVVLGPRVGSREDALVVLLPEITNLQRSYPWQRVSPAKVKPGTTLRLDDLPGIRLSVRVYHEGARALPETETVFLQPGVTVQHVVRFEAADALQGIVVDEQGRRIENALVMCETPDRVGTTLQYLKSMPNVLEEEIVPTLPPAAGEARTNFNGEFQLSSWPEFGATRYLSARSPDGKLWGGRAIGADTKQVELVVKPIESGRAELSLDFPGRNQSLPVVVTVGGEPRDEVLVPAGVPLQIGGLATGTWRLSAAWNGRSIVGAAGFEELELGASLTHRLYLPQGAIVGQDADTLLRAGRPVPSWAPAASAPLDGR